MLKRQIKKKDITLSRRAQRWTDELIYYTNCDKDNMYKNKEHKANTLIQNQHYPSGPYGESSIG